MPSQRGHIRSVEARLASYRIHGAPRAGLCANAVYRALNAEWQGLGSAASVARAVPPAAMHQLNAPRGAIVYWEGGRKRYGHCCFALGDHLELSVDVIPGRPGVAGMVPFQWFADNWPTLRYVGWSWWWGGIDTRPAVLTVREGRS